MTFEYIFAPFENIVFEMAVILSRPQFVQTPMREDSKKYFMKDDLKGHSTEGGHYSVH